jgi:hypothetical protein
MAIDDFQNSFKQREPNAENHSTDDSLPNLFIPKLVKVRFMTMCKHQIQNWDLKVSKICILKHNNDSGVEELGKKDNHHDHVCFL